MTCLCRNKGQADVQFPYISSPALGGDGRA